MVENSPPLVGDGQGRTGEDITGDATSWLWWAGVSCIVAGVLIWLLP